MKLTFPILAGTCLAALVATLPARAQFNPTPNVSALALASPVTGALPPSLQAGATPLRLVVRLADPPLLEAMAPNARRAPSMSIAQRRAYVKMLSDKQTALMAQIAALGGREIGRLGKVYNALMISAPTSTLPQIAKLPGVSALSAAPDATLSLSPPDTVPYIGAQAVQDLNVTGRGVTIAIVDSGIDYTHRNLGGSGLASDFAAASADTTVAPAGLFPTAKVIAGHDFVGDKWPNDVEAPDDNPIDAGSGAGHGTHVADIAAGASLDGTHKGVAPDAKLIAVKVCSSVSTACSGVAIMNGLEYLADPNGDLDFSDAPDVANLSLGGNYGQRQSPDAAAVASLVRFGMVVVVSAGNGGDRPYIVGSPANAAEAIAVAQTTMPAEVGLPLVVTAPASLAGTYRNTNTVAWAPVSSGFSGVVRAAGASGTPAAIACTPETTIDFTGSVALIDRGSCNISLKVKNATQKGALAVLVANNLPGDAPTFSSGGDTPVVQTLVITQDVGAQLHAAPAGSVRVVVDPDRAIALTGSIKSSSSRGPGSSFNILKPDIGAPGASVSALTGTGTREEIFSGTSGAAPMITGSAALLLQKFPSALPPEIKSRLMNGAFTGVYANLLTQPGVRAPVSRIGSGEVRVDAAAAATTGVWDATNPYAVGLSFGSVRAAGVVRLVKKVAIHNYAASARVYTIGTEFRDPAAAARRAVTLSAPATVSVPGNASGSFSLTLTIDAARLADWPFGAPGSTGSGVVLQSAEYDGYLMVSDAGGSATLPWHVLPHKSANVAPVQTSVALGGGATGTLGLSNVGGALAGTTEVFALTGRSPKFSNEQAAYGSNTALTDIKSVGVRSVDVGGGPYSGLQFAITTYSERTLPTYPAELDVLIDTNNDGTFDWALYNAESGGNGGSGQALVYLVKLAGLNAQPTGDAVAKFQVDQDLNSSTTIYTVAVADLGLNSTTQRLNFKVRAYDNLYSGARTDETPYMTYTPGAPKYTVDAATVSTAPGANRTITVSKGARQQSPSQSGFLLLHRDAQTGREADEIAVTP